MKKLTLYIFLCLIFFNKLTFAKNIPHPLDFNGSEQGKKNIISFIEKNVYDALMQGKKNCLENN